jgi:hypothetical protein
MVPRRHTMPEKLIGAREPTMHSCYAINPNGAKLGAAGARRHRFRRLQTVMANGRLHGFIRLIRPSS